MQYQPASATPRNPLGYRSFVRTSARSSLSSGIRIIALIAVLGMAASACGGGDLTETTTTTTAPTASSSTTAAASTTTAAAPATTAATTTTTSAASSTTAATTTTTTVSDTGLLSGKWSGNYSGSYEGTFDLTWQQSGSALTGTITLPSLGGDLAINGTVDGDTIQFGTVGSQEITYSGSVSGSSMSGTWEMSGAGSGSWSATKTSDSP